MFMRMAMIGSLGCLFCSLPAPAGLRHTTFFVSPAGNDDWSGQFSEPNAKGSDGPFATLERAKSAIRSAPKDRPRTVKVREGVYPMKDSFTLGPEDSGTVEHPVLWQAAPGEEVRLIGGQVLPAGHFHPVTDEALMARMDPETRKHVVQLDLSSLDIPAPAPLPPKFHGASEAPELFFNRQRMTVARWPNEGWTQIANIIDSGSNPREGDATGRPGIFQYEGDRPDRWQGEVWLLGYWCYDWYEESIQIKAIDRAQRQITLAAPPQYSLKQGNPSPRRYVAFNLLEELDQPGEYFIDRERALLFFWPPSDLSKAQVELSMLDRPVVLLKDASHVILRGFMVSSCRGNGIEIQEGRNDRIEGCEICNTRLLGISVQGGQGHGVDSCDIHDTGTGGLRLAGGDRRTLTPAGHWAENNHIWGFSKLMLTYACAIFLEGVGNRASHNLLHDSPHMAVGLSGNDHLFEYNEIHTVCTETDDCGALYKGRNPSCRGNLIRFNFFHHIGKPMGHGNAAIYFDDGDGGDTVFGNVFFRSGEPGKGPFGTVFSHGGHGILAENNLFIECQRALGSAPWKDDVWKIAIQGGLDCKWKERLLQEVDITQPPYTTRYPELVGFLDPKPGQPRVSQAKNNLLVQCNELSNGNWTHDPEDNWMTDKDPGFKDMSQQDFRLKRTSEVTKRLPNFHPIPFERIGLVKSKLRPKKACD